MYDTADAVRLEALANSSFKPLADVVAKVRREERYHLMHLDAWLRRMATGADEPRQRLQDAMLAVRPDAHSVFTPLAGEQQLIESGILRRAIRRAHHQVVAVRGRTPDRRPWLQV